MRGRTAADLKSEVVLAGEPELRQPNLIRLIAVQWLQ
jgi:hypothetical protein